MANEPDNSPPPPTHTENEHIGGNHILRLAAISAVTGGGKEGDLQKLALEILKKLETIQRGKE